VPAERLYIYIISIKETSFGGAKFWALIADNHKDYCWSFVMKNKLDLKGKTLLTNLKITGIYVKFIRCNDTSKNMTMKNDPEIKSIDFRLEFYCPRNP
jgi:hypothetical protein